MAYKEDGRRGEKDELPEGAVSEVLDETEEDEEEAGSGGGEEEEKPWE